MNNSYNFSIFNRQSTKGIVIIYLQNIYAILKKAWVLIPALLIGKKNPLKLKMLLLIFAVILVLILIKAILTYLNFKFKIVDNHFVLKQGILRKKQLSIPFERIQNVSFKQNFIQQIINVTQVEIETAGAKKTEISIKALSRKKAEAIKAFIFNKKQIEDVAEEEIIKPILKISIVDLIKVSITENHIKSFILFLAFLGTIYNQIRDYIKESNINKTVAADVEQTINTVYGIFILLFLGLIIALVISFARVFLLHFNLTMSLKKNTIEIVQGLFTKRNYILKKEKVQYIVQATNPLKKLLGISSILIMQANSGKVKQSKMIKIVGCKKKHLESIKEILYQKPNLDTEIGYKPHKYYMFQMALRSSIVLIAINIFFFILRLKHPNIFFFNLLLIPIIIILIYAKYRKSYYKFNEEILIKYTGQVGIQITYFEYFKLQSITKRQTVFQKRRAITDLILHTATGKIKLPCLTEKQAKKMYNYFIYQTEISTKKWM